LAAMLRSTPPTASSTASPVRWAVLVVDALEVVDVEEDQAV